MSMFVSDNKIGLGTTYSLSALTIRPKASFNVTGTVATTIDSTFLTGTNTQFLFELGLGDRIEVGPDVRTVITIDGNRGLNVDVPFTATATGLTAIAYPSTARFETGAGEPKVVISDQGNVGLGTLTPNASVDIANGGAGDWLGLPVNLRSHMPEDSVGWGMVLTDAATGPDTGAAVWVFCGPFGPMLAFTLTSDCGCDNDTLLVDGTAVYVGGGFLTTCGCPVSDDYTLTESDYYVFVDTIDSARTIKLPSIVPFNFGRVYYVFKSAGYYDVTIVPAEGEPLNGLETNVTISASWEGVKLVASMDGWVATRLQLGNTVVPTSVAANRAISLMDDHMYVDAGADGCTLTLPPLAVNIGRMFHVFKSAGAGNVTIAPDGTDNINGVNASKTISTPFAGLKLVAGTANTWVATILPAA
jgi:hypothetical protein